MSLTKEEQDQLAAILNAEVRLGPAGKLEDAGWREWLKTIWPFWFSEEFSEEHVEFWEWWWSILMRIKNGGKIELWEFVVLLILGRGLGKSASTEAARVMRGAILNKGYSLIISETDDQATEHLGNARLLIEHPDSRLLEFYPNMAIADNADALKGMPTADRKEMFICKNGYILRAKGLTAKMRGLRVGILRPDDINLDDVDDVNDSLAVSLNKLRLITSSIVPVQARENVTITFSQNLIAEHSVLNQILTGKSDALAERKVIGPTPAFTHLDISSEIDETGKLRHVILPTSIPSWSGLDIKRAQKFLNDSGLETFKAEYQNEFDQFRSGKVIPEYNEKVQIITWSEFESVYGTREIPHHWQRMCGLDVGYSVGQYPHYSAWVFVATSAANSALPGKVFVYLSRTFKGVSIDDQAEAINNSPTGFVSMWKMSHEKTGEMMTLRQKYKLPFSKFTKFGNEDGVAQWRHLSKIDFNKPHPFRDMDGDCTLFYIVEDGQEVIARDDNGHRLLREQVSTWELVPTKVTETGQTVQKPAKINDDACDALRGILVYFGPVEKALTPTEKIIRDMPEEFREENIKHSGQRMAQMMYLEKEFKRRHESSDDFVMSR